MKDKNHKKTKTLKKALERSKELGEAAASNDFSEAQDQVDKKLSAMNRGPIKKVWDKVLFLWEKFKSPELPLRLKITIIGALLYLILPTDVIADAIPGLGLIDDLSVIMIVFREVSKYLLPKIEKKIEEKLYQSCYQKIDDKLSLIFKNTLINTLWSFLANLLGCLILVIKPFGEKPSRYVAIAIFILIAIWAIIRIIIYLQKYGATSLKISRPIIKNKSISKGLAEFVRQEYAYINELYAGIEIAKSFIPQIPEIPDLPQIIKTFEKHYKKRIILFLLIFALYSLLIWGTKFLLLK
ncbi:MAG: DUF1232 domain-containing protein [Treponema sp.]|nr:DUF1232 domain-containing protein [Treponema sp.]